MDEPTKETVVCDHPPKVIDPKNLRPVWLENRLILDAPRLESLLVSEGFLRVTSEVFYNLYVTCVESNFSRNMNYKHCS